LKKRAELIEIFKKEQEGISIKAKSRRIIEENEK